MGLDYHSYTQVLHIEDSKKYSCPFFAGYLTADEIAEKQGIPVNEVKEG